MTTFVFTSPEGKDYEVEGPEGATEAQAFEVLQQQLGAAPAAPESEDPAAIKAEQDRISESMSDPLGGLGGDEDASEGAGISLGDAVTSAPFLAGIGQRFMSAKRGIAQLFATQEEAENYARIAAEEAAALKAHHARNPADAAAFSLGTATEAIGEGATLARYIPSPAKIGLGGSGAAKAAGRIGYGAAVGGTVAATHVTEPGESKAGQMAVGAAFGGLSSGLVEAFSAAARPVAGLFTTKKEAAASGGMLKENPAYERGLAVEEATGVKLTPGQVTGSPALSEMRPPKGFAETQAKQTLRNFVKLRDEIAVDAKPPVHLAQKFGDATDDIYRGLVETRKKVGDFRYEKFRGSVKEVYADKFIKKMDEIAADAVPGTDSGKISLLRDKLAKQVEESGGTLSTKQLLGWKERIDDLMAGKSDIFKDLSKSNQRRLGGQLMDSLYASLSDTADALALQGKTSPASLLKQAVADYKKFSAPIRELEESALGAIFRARGPDGKSIKITPEGAARKLMTLEPTQVRAMYNVLDRYNPNLIQQYRATKLYEAMKSSVATTPDTAERLASQTKFDPKAAIKKLNSKNELRAVFEQDPALMRRVNNGMALLDRVSDRMQSGAGGKQGVTSRAAEVTANAVSGSPIFIARTGAKILGPVGLWKLTSTKEGIRALHTLATAPLKSTQFAAAAESLVMNLDDNGPGVMGE